MFKELELPGTYAIHNFYENDKRGLFRKNYNAQYFNKFISKFNSITLYFLDVSNEFVCM